MPIFSQPTKYFPPAITAKWRRLPASMIGTCSQGRSTAERARCIGSSRARPSRSIFDNALNGRAARKAARLLIGRLFDRLFVHLRDVVPIDQMIEERFQIIRPPIAIVDVVGMLPYVAAEDRLAAMYQRIFAVWRFRHGNLAVLDGEPAPT